MQGIDSRFQPIPRIPFIALPGFFQRPSTGPVTFLPPQGPLASLRETSVRWSRNPSLVREAHVIDESRLRHPQERAIFIGCVVINLALMAGAIYITASGAEWLEAYPRLAKWADAMRAAAVLAILSPPTLVLMRNMRRA